MIRLQADELSTGDASKLTALVQAFQESDDSDAGSPDAAVYESRSANIVETLQGLNDKAEGSGAEHGRCFRVGASLSRI